MHSSQTTYDAWNFTLIGNKQHQIYSCHPKYRVHQAWKEYQNIWDNWYIRLTWVTESP